MGEAELIAIEQRLEQYPLQARQDILWLMRELRRLSEGASGRSAREGSPLYDALTGLLNAGAYGVRFAAARARATRYRKIFAVMSVDLDANETRAEATIRAVAERLERCVRATDTLARIGEHNFAIILEDLTQSGHAERVKQIVQDALSEGVETPQGKRVPAISVRLEFYPQPPQASPLH